MVPTDITTGHPFTPSWRKDEPNPPRFFIRGAGVIERAQIEAELSGEYQAGRVFSFEVLNAFRAGLQSLLADDPGLDHLLELVQAESDGTVLESEDRQALIDAKAVLARHWPEYQQLIAQQDRRREIAPIVIFRRLCIGWENVDATLERGRDKLITEAALLKIEPMEMVAAGNFAYGILYPDLDERNFPPPSPSDGDPKISSSDTPPADGSSATSDGPKILA